MSELETYECDACGEQFTAYPDANAADSGYCSPTCDATDPDSQS